MGTRKPSLTRPFTDLDLARRRTPGGSVGRDGGGRLPLRPGIPTPPIWVFITCVRSCGRGCRSRWRSTRGAGSGSTTRSRKNRPRSCSATATGTVTRLAGSRASLTLEPYLTCSRPCGALLCRRTSPLLLRLGPLIDVCRGLSEGNRSPDARRGRAVTGVQNGLWRTTQAVIDAPSLRTRLAARLARDTCGHAISWHARELYRPRTATLAALVALLLAALPARPSRSPGTGATSRRGAHNPRRVSPRSGKLRRSGRAIANAFKRQSDHDSEHQQTKIERETR